MPAHVTTPAPARPGPGAADTAITMLQALGTTLDSLSLRTSLLIQAGKAPVLTVTNPNASQLSERICAAPLAGTWHYFWSWACATRRCHSEWRWETVHLLAVAAAG